MEGLRAYNETQADGWDAGPPVVLTSDPEPAGAVRRGRPLKTPIELGQGNT
jgi:hypothetical protein